MKPIILLLFVLLFDKSYADPLKDVDLVTPSSELIHASIAYKEADIFRGLSGVKPEEFAEDQGKLFFYFQSEWRTFWMPRTFFNLDLIYLDKTLKIINIVRNLPCYEGSDGPRVPRAPEIYSRHVLEMKASSPTAARLSVGERLTWKSELSLEETERRMRRGR